MHLGKAYSGMFTYCLMKQQLVYLLWASVFKVSSSLFMGHIETSLLCVTCILVTARGLSQQLLFALDCQMNGCSHRLYWGFLRPLCPQHPDFLEQVDLNQGPLWKPAQLCGPPLYRWRGPSIFCSMFPSIQHSCWKPDQMCHSWHLAAPFDALWLWLCLLTCYISQIDSEHGQYQQLNLLTRLTTLGSSWSIFSWRQCSTKPASDDTKSFFQITGSSETSPTA